MHDDGVGLVALNHTDIEEASVFAIHGFMKRTAITVAMILRRLHQPDARIGEGGNEIIEPRCADHIVGIEYPDDFSIRCGVLYGKTERAGFKTLKVVDAQKLEALSEHRAVCFDGLPMGGIGRVVDDDDTLDVRIGETRHRIERAL